MEYIEDYSNTPENHKTMEDTFKINYYYFISNVH